jgi:ribA/ribD-fused uncharacterized protein
VEEFEQFTFFWNGPFSQWEPCTFVLDGLEYNCAEQYMMAEKARYFRDEENLEAILEAEDPRTQKEFGRLVEGFDEESWQEEESNGRPYCWNVVWRGSMAKFSQNAHLLKSLLATQGTTLVEASPYDTIWGIGLRKNDPNAKNRATWRGTNWLGEVLTVVRDLLAAHPGRYASTAQMREWAELA